MEKTGFFDVNGKEIYVGQYAEVRDRKNNKWIGKIECLTAEFQGHFIVDAVSVDVIYVFSSNMYTWLGDWTKYKLKIVDPTERIKKKYLKQQSLKWDVHK